jgi:uncharacterized protein
MLNMNEYHLPEAEQPVSPLNPTPPGERILDLDVLRGFALLGILLVNMQIFGWPVYLVLTGLQEWDHPADQMAEHLIRFFAEGKFYSLFSFLFGLGMAIQLRHARERGRSEAPFLFRRLFILLLIGLCHILFVWEGDILVDYALLGMLLLLFRNRKQSTLLFWGGFFLLLPAIFYSGIYGLASALGAIQETGFGQWDGSWEAIERNLEVFSTGTYLEIFQQRLKNIAFFYAYSIASLPHVFALFLFGFCAGRAGLFQPPGEHLTFFHWGWAAGLLLGLVGNGIYLWAFSFTGLFGWKGTAGLFGFVIGAPALSLFYAASLVKLLQKENWRRRLAPVASVGRMALSNYLFQSVVCTTIFYSYGLGLYGRVGLAASVALAFSIYLAQLPLSSWWLRRFHYGPAEWVWRALTYGALPDWKRKKGLDPIPEK